MALNSAEETEAGRIMTAHRQSAAQIESGSAQPGDKAIMLARNAVPHLDALQALADRSDARVKSETQRAWQDAFGMPRGASDSTVLAARDAIDRMSDASPSETARLLQQAVMTGDVSLAKAAGARAMTAAANDPLRSSSWGGIVNSYVSAFPAAQQAVTTLAGHAADRADSRTVMRDQMLRRLPMPAALRGRDVRALARQPLSTEQAG
jgi:hypothetical protein